MRSSSQADERAIKENKMIVTFDELTTKAQEKLIQATADYIIEFGIDKEKWEREASEDSMEATLLYAEDIARAGYVDWSTNVKIN